MFHEETLESWNTFIPSVFLGLTKQQLNTWISTKYFKKDTLSICVWKAKVALYDSFLQSGNQGARAREWKFSWESAMF